MEDQTPQPQPVRPAPWPPAPAQPQNGLGLASFVLGIIALATAFIPLAGWFISPPVAFTGLGVGLGNLPRLRKGKADNKAQTWIGVGLSVGAIFVSIGYIVVVAIGASQS